MTLYSVTLTPNDARSTDASELLVEIRTAAGGGPNLLASARMTSGVAGSITYNDPYLVAGTTNTRYVRVYDGAANPTDTAFSFEVPLPDPDPIVAAPVIGINFVFEWRDHRFALIEDITLAVTSASVEMVNDRAIARRATFEIDGTRLAAAAPLFDLEKDRISIHARFTATGETLTFPLGLFALDVTDEIHEATGDPDGADVHVTYPAEGADVVSHLEESTMDASYTVEAGTGYIAAVQALIEGLLFPDFNGRLLPLKFELPELDDVTPIRFTWPPRSTRLGIMNDLLAGVNCYPIWADERATLRTRVRSLLSRQPIAYRYTTTAEPRMIVSPFRRRRRTAMAANRILAVQDDPARASITTARENSDPDSSISTANQPAFQDTLRTPRIVDADTQLELVDYELAYRHAAANRAALVTLFDPRRTNRELYGLQLAGVEDDTRWLVFGWRLRMEVGALMSHDVGRADTLDLVDLTL